jgi:CheY-like chemotaxis protein
MNDVHHVSASEPPGGPQARGDFAGRGQRAILQGVPVLVVEDDAASAKLLAALLRSEGCVVSIARSAEEALATLVGFEARVVIVDLVLPKMSGFLFVERVMADPATKDAVLIAVSALNGEATAEMARRAGCADYVRKPIEIEGFLDLVVRHLGGKQ